ncbi:hypothetical protein F4X33_05455 [Candidatus Poribacteria bacterium]|nr:hypothetical protein [Candidatus Poribacteria bacterium]
MRKTLIMLTGLVAVNMAGWQIAWSQQIDSFTDPDESASVDENQIILAEYQWNGKKNEISLADFKAAIGELSIFQQENYASKAGKTEYLPEFIDKELKVLAAIDKGLNKDEDIVKKAREYKHTLLIERLTLIEVDEKVFPTEEDRRRYYEEHKSEYIEEAAARVTCISVLEKMLAQEALAQIKAGTNISELAKELSEKDKLFGPGSNKTDPGNTGLFTKDESEDWQAFVDAAFEMKVGDITEEILELEMDHETYYLIFRKEEHLPERIADFEEVRDYIEPSVKREKKRQRIIEWVAEVTSTSGLKTYPERIPEAVLDQEEPVTNAENIIIAEFDCDGKQQITLAEMIQDIRELSEYTPQRYKDKARLEEYVTLMAEGRLILCLAKERELEKEPEIQRKTRRYLHTLLSNKLWKVEVEEKVKVTEEGIRANYETRKSEFAEEEQVRLTCITLRDSDRAKEVFESIRSGKEMVEVAKELSDTGELTGPGADPLNPGDTGYLTRDTFPKEQQAFTDAAFAMEVGQTVDDIMTVSFQGRQYYTIFRKEEHNLAHQKTLNDSEVRRIVTADTQTEMRNALTAKLHTQLRNKARLKIYLDRIPEQPDK